MLLEALSRHVAIFSLDDFYHLSRAALVKDESQYDRFDRAFAAYFKGVEAITGELFGSIPEDWLRLQAQKHLTPEEMAKIQALGGLDKLMETLKQRLEEQKERHEGGNKWVGTRSEEHTSELQSLMRISYAVCCVKKKKNETETKKKQRQ